MTEIEDRLTNCIDIVLEQLGTDVRRALLFHFRREKGIKHYEIFQNPTEFIDALHSVLGSAANNIESEIIHTIEHEFKLTHNEDQDLVTIFNKLQQNFANKTKIEKIEKIESNNDLDDLTYMQYGRKSIKKKVE